MDKASFLKQELVAVLGRIPADRQPAWGKMNLQQMTEHLGREGFGWASGRIPQTEVLTPVEQLPRMQNFLQRDDTEFRENTVNKLMGETPPALVHTGMPAALAALQQEIDHFFVVFAAEQGRRSIHPFFGELDYEEWVLLLYKHARHHLKQFGAIL